MQIYKYDGPVFDYNGYYICRYLAHTTAVSSSKALSNIRWKVSREMNKPVGCVRLDPGSLETEAEIEPPKLTKKRLEKDEYHQITLWEVFGFDQ